MIRGDVGRDVAGARAPRGRGSLQVDRPIRYYFGEAARDRCGRADQACRGAGRIPSVSPEWDLLDFCREHGIVLQAFAALGHAMEPKVLDDPVITAIAQRVHKTPAQVALAWAVQRGTAFLTTSTKPQRIQENFDISTLPEDAMREIRDRITTNVRFNSVVETGVPGFIPRARRTEFSGAEPQDESGELRVRFAGERGWATQRQLLALFAESLSISFAVRIESSLRPCCHAAFSSGVVMSQSGRHFLLTERRSWRSSSIVGRPKNQ